ncbi:MULTISPECIES: iron-sulfur cluster carrier protein ApbC [unclassified Methylophaga]|jgi:ATP-binding protein involved in chromosome partitioning|uniref:Iron-sulfur cluster carrier protein n=1 Tax=Pseudidiomarina aestuarii TaxID=624146 RepID=A0A2T4CXN3_9GAMM|nr:MULTISPECIES: iron-sulfur cluster carrier protein ApbC [unclassified Methylophaga]PTB86305.1 iron-sulfur cluster carrier protein ApbC [Pseudidiomarina aestuarii]MAL50561.1 iron-sulfur cluster carrier protein ApbC [Methylophaga sp.]MAP25814.1 iron-sulfur cluster carrier protein ApbC [Methylophaga sp.]MBP25173.1 iron-sulfur cluster carrier protein ApbC [Methylophaga sp.]MDX1749253.1 iron-sulfur cluster carrier protein ApbC [Methylophaga sp.]|tara:strand:- start:12500 stop:13582 length:1083 start_codon:yes stop_codon:yes gene_type:complete
MTSPAQIEEIVKNYQDPSTLITLGDTRATVKVSQDDNQTQVDVTLGYPVKGYAAELAQNLKQLIEAEGAANVSVNITTKIVKHKVQQGVPALENVKNIIAVASGKGGVGKSTTSVNLALALAAEGATVGILDADIYGPSQPRMLGTTQRPESVDGKSIEPIESYGIQSMSIGFLIDEEEPMIWRGPMVTQALQQMLGDTNWKELDYLVIDLPPGTGDIQLTLSQKVPVSGAVIVTTPQDISLLDARKALKMFEKVKVPVLGVVENMSTHICSQCGHEEHIFGAGGGQSMADQYGVNMLGSLPLDIHIREDADNGQPTVVKDPDGDIALAYRVIARRIAANLAMQGKNYSAAFPNIVIKND